MTLSRQSGIIRFALCLIVLAMLMSTFRCKSAGEDRTTAAESDEKAVAIAEEVLQACGGKKNWRNTRYLVWRCLGKRMNVWDKLTGDIRVESRKSIVLMNLNTMQGRAWLRGREITEKDELRRAMEYGYEAWVNDSYWVFLPFKLRDPGVILKYVGEGKSDEGGNIADILSLTFQNVGLTPENKYHIYVDRKSKLIVRWDFYLNASDPEPRFTMPWKNYKSYGKILLSDDRGTKKHTDMAVFDQLPEDILRKPERPDWGKLIRSAEEARQG